jgi:hypothetical protein
MPNDSAQFALSLMVRVHRILGALAVLHSVLLFAILLCVYTGVFSPLGFSSWPWGVQPLWVGLASLWLLWPLVLVLHPGRSLLRVALPVAIGRWQDQAEACGWQISQEWEFDALHRL